jgi:hypothetical protein
MGLRMKVPIMHPHPKGLHDVCKIWPKRVQANRLTVRFSKEKMVGMAGFEPTIP